MSRQWNPKKGDLVVYFPHDMSGEDAYDFFMEAVRQWRADKARDSDDSDDEE